MVRQRYDRGRVSSPAGAGDQTDDTGAFRLYALPPGDYYLAASLRAAGAGGFVEATVGVPTSIRAPRRSGRHSASAGSWPGAGWDQLRRAAVRAVTVSGVVVLASGAPARDTTVTLLSEGGDFSVISTPLGNFGRTGTDGSFTMPNVAPGSYLLRARAGAVFDPMSGQGEEALMPLVVGPEGVSGLTVTTIRTPPIVGTVVADSGTPLPNQVIAVGVREPSSGADFQITARRPDAPGGAVTFRVPGMLGQLALTVDTPRGWMLKQVDLDGRDITDRLFELRGSSPDVRVTLTNRLTRVSGTVRSAERGAGGGHRRAVCRRRRPVGVSLAPRHDGARRRPWRLHGGGPAPHEYLAVAVDDLDAGASEDPDFLESLRERATRFSIDYGETVTLSLDLPAR